MSARVKKFLPEIKRVARLTAKDRQKFVKTCSKDFIFCVCECIKNVLKDKLPLKPHHLKVLRKHKGVLRKLALKKTSLATRRKILQKGGFLAALLPALVGGLGSIIGPLVNRWINPAPRDGTRETNGAS
jgi:hypothetical protein